MVGSQELSDIPKRGTVAKHLRRQGVPQPVGGTARGPLDPGPCHGTSKNAPNGCRRREATMRSQLADEQSACCAGDWPTVQQTGSDSLTDLAGQWQKIATVVLARNRDDASGPDHVVERQSDDFASPQAQPSQEQQDGVVAPPNRGTAVTTLQERVDLVRCKGFRQAGEAPVRNPRYGASNIRGNVTALVKMTEKAPQGADHDLRPAGADLLAGTPGVPIDIAESRRSGVEGVVRKPVAEKGVYDPQAILVGDRAQSLLITQETLIPACDLRDRRDIALPYIFFGREIVDCTQPIQQRTPRSQRTPGPLAPPSEPRVKQRGVRMIELPFLKPGVERSHQAQLGLPRTRRIPLLCEPRVETLQMRHEGAACCR